MAQDKIAENEFTARLAEREPSVGATKREKVEEYREARFWRWHARHGFLHHIQAAEPKTILDFGCGSGEMVTRLALMGNDVTGIDLSPEMTDLARERIRADGVEDRARVITGDVMEVDLDERFDLIAAMLIMHHLEIQPALEALLKCLKPEGTIVFWEPVAFSKSLQWVRDHSGLKKEISPNERQLNRRDLALISSYFGETEIHYYRIFDRLRRVLPGSLRAELGPAHRFLGSLDGLELRLLPPMRHFAGSVVIVCRR